MSDKTVVCDIDGVIATGTTEDVYSDAAGWAYEKCTPIENGIEVLRCMKDNCKYTVILHTARPAKDRKKTEAWLKKHNVKYDKLVMGKPGGVYLDDRSFPTPFKPGEQTTWELVKTIEDLVDAVERGYR